MAAIFEIYMLLLAIGIIGVVFKQIDTLFLMIIDALEERRMERKRASSVNHRRRVNHRTKFGV